ncbi:flagellar hook protein FlgK [Stenotrophomonas ginsengisoli]|uniref:Flagellar hook-associated protein 1 n=1 Tax=Stenotrophomonas ginsengisoli TaxID=336566 RepID=A0A0R0DKZ5_9GAMM|nr:flagellar hook-associated protein FlgK [Stenotrophomonas ginsengisoli]KRG78913.1 flagellar hook protein FlgK [Stenotrophomonas ginsengisoli]
MTSVLNTSSSALLAFQRALSTVSHNVANINTEGYSRQSTELSSATPQKYGFGYLGNGTTVADVRRVADQLAITRLIGSNAEVAHLQTLSGLSDRVDSLMSDSTTNLEGRWSAFYNALSGLSSESASTAQRQNTLDEATALAGRFGRLNGQMDALNQEVNNGLIAAASEINRLSGEIAQLNRQIGANPAKASPDLLDRRDTLANQLVSYTGGSINLQDGGVMNVFTAGGTALVVGPTAARVEVIADSFQPERLQLALVSSNLTVDLSNSGLGGSVGGLLDFRRDVLDPAQAELGRIALGLAQSLNAQQAAGVDLYGERGQDLFTIGSPQVLAAGSNSGSASVQIDSLDLAKLDGSNIKLTFNGTAWQATKLSNGEAVAMTGSGTAADPFVVNGMSVQLSGAAAANDSFLLKPAAGLAGSLQVAISDPARIAAASAVQGSASLANTGSGRMNAVQVIDASQPNLTNASVISFTSASQYTIDGAGPYPYTPGSTISANGWQFSLDGAPNPGDSFNVSPTGAGSSDNGNANLLAATEDLRLFANGTQSLTDVMAGLTTRVGSAARGAEYSLEAATVLQQQAQSARDSISGVNLDEEAAQMLKLQQAYQAASQMVSTADTMFQTILGAVSR